MYEGYYEQRKQMEKVILIAELWKYKMYIYMNCDLF